MRSQLLIPALFVLSGCISTSHEVGEAPPRPASAAAESFQVVPLKFAVAAELSGTLNDLFASTGGTAASSIRIVADPRTNSLVIQAPPEVLPHILGLVAKLDTEVR